MSRVTVREAQDADEREFEEVWATAMATLRETYRMTPGFLDQWTPPSDLTRVVALVDGRVVGVVQYYIEEDRLHIMRFGVHPDLRGQGIGRAIIGYLDGIARDKGLRCLSVYTVKETGNVPIYQHLGFHVIREEEAKWAESDRFDTLTDVYSERPISNLDG